MEIILAFVRLRQPAERENQISMQLRVAKQPVATFQLKRWLLIASILPLLCLAGYAAGFILVSNSADETIRQAQRSLAIGEPAKATQQLQSLIWFEPDHAAANFLIGQCFLELKKYDSAIAHFELVKATESEFKASQQMLAGCYLNDNQLEKAENVLSRILQSFPRSLPVRRELAVLFLGQMRADDAVLVLLESIKQQTALSTEERLTVLRELLLAQFVPPTAEACMASLQGAHAQHPGQKTVMAALSECLLDLGRLAEAETLIDQLSTMSEFETTAAVLKLRFLISQANYSDARKLSTSIEEDFVRPTNDLTRIHARFYILKSKLQELADEYDATVQSLERAESIGPLDRSSAIRYARLLQRAGKIDVSSKLFAAAHRRAEAELALWHLSGKVRERPPSRDECERISRHFDALGKSHQAAEWRRMANELESPTGNPTGFGFRISQ
jgi:thioredoxin-like negative regulator of GroEL